MFQHNEQLYSVKDALKMFKDKPAGELKIKLELPESLPEVFTFQQLMDRLGLAYAVVNLIDNCKVHAGKKASIKIAASSDRDFQYIDVGDSGPGIKDLAKLKREVVVFGRGDHSGSSLDLASLSIGLLGGVIIPSNVEDGESIVGANFRIQLPLDPKNMNKEYSRELRQKVAKDLGLG